MQARRTKLNFKWILKAGCGLEWQFRIPGMWRPRGVWTRLPTLFHRPFHWILRRKVKTGHLKDTLWGADVLVLLMSEGEVREWRITLGLTLSMRSRSCPLGKDKLRHPHEGTPQAFPALHWVSEVSVLGRGRKALNRTSEMQSHAICWHLWVDEEKEDESSRHSDSKSC